MQAAFVRPQGVSKHQSTAPPRQHQLQSEPAQSRRHPTSTSQPSATHAIRHMCPWQRARTSTALCCCTPQRSTLARAGQQCAGSWACITVERPQIDGVCDKGTRTPTCVKPDSKTVPHAVLGRRAHTTLTCMLGHNSVTRTPLNSICSSSLAGQPQAGEQSYRATQYSMRLRTQHSRQPCCSTKGHVPRPASSPQTDTHECYVISCTGEQLSCSNTRTHMQWTRTEIDARAAQTAPTIR